MTFIHAGAASAAMARMLMRVCPSCRNQQITKISELKESVPCKRCGKAIPPKK